MADCPPPNEPLADPKSETRRRGRPVQMDQETREAVVLNAAAELLASHGLAEASVAAIARKAGMSKRTIYQMFDSREALLGACLARIGQSLFRPLSEEHRTSPLEDRLRVLLTFSEDHCLTDAPLELLRAVITEAPTYPQLARGILDTGHCALARFISAELRAGVATGELDLPVDQCDEAAEMLMDMAFGSILEKLLDPASMPHCAETKAARRDRAIALFLSGARPR